MFPTSMDITRGRLSLIEANSGTVIPDIKQIKTEIDRFKNMNILVKLLMRKHLMSGDCSKQMQMLFFPKNLFLVGGLFVTVSHQTSKEGHHHLGIYFHQIVRQSVNSSSNLSG